VRTDACHQLAHFERFGHIVVRAKLETDDHVDGVALRGEHDDRHARTLGTQPAADVEPAHAREVHVEDDQVRVLLASEIETLDARCRLDERVVLGARRKAHDFATRLVVLDDENGLSSPAHQTGTSMNVEMRFTKLATSIGLVM
jgi:hypothetical protein